MKILFGFILVFFFGISTAFYSQTEADGLRMEKNNLCLGLAGNYSSWNYYWEGAFRRNNANLGTVSTSAIGFMGNYGAGKRLNIIFSLPYVQTKATAGTLKGQRGLQDFNLFLKWLATEKKCGKGTFTLYGVAGASSPTHNYVADYLPLSIGLKSRTLSVRPILDYQTGYFFVTGSANYIYRYNVKLDRNSYYTDKMIYSNMVYMPNVFSSRLGMGYRDGDKFLEFVLETWNTLGGFDIRKNDMPFPSNRMNMVRSGLNFKYPFKKPEGLAIVGNCFYTIHGRNVGQSLSFMGGVFYVFNLSKKE